MSEWSDYIELRSVDGETRAFRTSDGREVPIPKLPPPESRKPGNGLVEWFDHLTLDELEAARKFHWDKWNWESGLDSDRLLSDLIETKISFRVHRLKMTIQKITSVSDGRITLDLRHTS